MNMPELRLEKARMHTSAWRPEGFDTIAATIPLITAADVAPILPELDLWDSWPLTDVHGQTADVDGRQFWFMLSAPRFDDPGQRHDVARIRLVSHGSDGWKDHGNAMPDGFSPGSREWAGSAVLEEDGCSVTLYFTAAGRRGEAHSFEQRLFAGRGTLRDGTIGDWQPAEEVVRADGQRYVIAREAEGRPGLIKAFRDPAWFRDPATGLCHILFTGSAAWSDEDFNGLIGMATLQGDGTWRLDDPLIEAVAVNNELERPHLVMRDGRYYLFWSTQRRTFDPACAAGPNGLYGAVADSLAGPWRMINGSGLVAGNPASEPTQGYSWWVTGSGEVWSFIDHWGMEGRSFADHPELLRGQFGGTPAPTFRLLFAGDQVTIAD